jgi:succinate dehydrogenase/fumarate reductase flavoprotein subunit
VIYRRLRQPANDITLSTGLIQEFLHREQAKLDALIAGNGDEEANALRTDAGNRRMGSASFHRRKSPLRSTTQALVERTRNIGLRYRSRGANRARISLSRAKMVKLALCVALWSAHRTESRGAFRQDYRGATTASG